MATSGSVNTSSYDGRYYQVSWTATQSVEKNQSTVSWTLKAVGGNDSWYAERTLSVTLGGSTVYSKTARVERYTGTIASGTKTITHNSVGDASFSINIQAAVYGSSVNCTGSKTFTLTNIPRKSTLTVANGTMGTAQTLTVTRKSTSFTHTITFLFGDVTSTICTKSTSTSISWTPPLTLANQIPNATQGYGTMTITTYNGNTAVGSVGYKVYLTVPASAKPSCSVAISDSTGYASTYGGYIKGLSKFKVTVTPTLAYSSPIASYSTTANGSTYTAASFTTGVLKSSGTLTVKATVKDKRGRSGTASKTATVLDYSKPKISLLKVKRCDEDGTENISGEFAQVTFSASVTSLNSKNKATYKLEYKKSSDATYTAVTFTAYANVYSVSNITHIFAADSGSTYNVRLTVTDAFCSTQTPTSLSTANVLMHWRADGNGMGFGKIGELANCVDFGYQIRPQGGFYRVMVANGTDLNTLKDPNIMYCATDASTLVNAPTGNSGNILGAHPVVIEVFAGGVDGYRLQRITSIASNQKTCERYYNGSWSAWVRTASRANANLWAGAYFMHDTQTITLSEPISMQANGIVLVFSGYSGGEAKDYWYNTFFISKYEVKNHAGKGHSFFLCDDAQLGTVGTKYLYISDSTITGNTNNDTGQTTSASGIITTNNAFVLRHIIGV